MGSVTNYSIIGNYTIEAVGMARIGESRVRSEKGGSRHLSRTILCM